MFGALKYTAKMLGLRKPRDAVDPQFTRPQGFHDPNDLDLNKLRRLIKRGKLAPCYPGRDAADDGETEARPLDADAAKGSDGTSSGDIHFSPFSTNAGKANATSEEPGIGKKDERAKPVRTQAASSPSSKPKHALAGGPRATDECPICFLCYPCLNKSRCCSSEICTECYLRVCAPSNAPEEYDRAGRRLLRPPKCPFCNTEGYGVAFGGAKSDADRAAEAEERAALAKALEAARAAELAEQAERRARRASVEARRASVEAPNDPSSASAAQTPGAIAEGADGADGEPLPESLPSSPVPVGWEEEYAAMTPTDPAVGSNRVLLDRHGGDRGAYRSASFIRASFGEHPRTRAPRESLAEEEARRRASRRRDRDFSPLRASRDFPATTTTSSSSSRRGARARAFLPAGAAFLPRNPHGPAELLTGDPVQHRAGGIGLGSSRGGPASGGHATHASREARSGDERRVLREIARRAESRRERRRLVAERDAPRGGDGGDDGDDGDDGDEAFLARVRDFIPARLLEDSFGDLGGEDVDGEEALDVASRALDIDDVMMMEAVYLSLQEQEEANRRRADAPSAGAAAAEAAEAAEVEEAIALVAAAEAAEAAERAGRSAAATTTERVDASREATEDAEGAGATRSSSGELELERDEVSSGREAPEGVSVVHEADSAVDEAGLTGDEAETGETDAFDAVDESLAALEAEASRITAHRVSPLSRRPATPPAAADADADAEKSSPRAPPPDADDTAYPAVEIETPALEAEPEAEAARASADAAGAPRAGEEKKNAPEENEPAPEPAARGSETLPSAPGAGAGAGAGTDAVAETAGDAHDANANVERAVESVERASSAP